MGPQFPDQRLAAVRSVQGGDIVQFSRTAGQQVGLRIIDHLHAMLDGPQQAISVAELYRVGFCEMSAGLQCGNRVERRAWPERGVAAAVDHLLDLGEELDFANAAATALEVIAGAELGPLREMIADSSADLADFLDDSEVERAAPDEWPDRFEEVLGYDVIAGGGAGADEGGALPRQSGGFVIGNGGVDRQRDRRHFRRGTQAEVDAGDIAVGGAFLQQFDQPPPDPNGRLGRILARPPWQALWVE